MNPVIIASSVFACLFGGSAIALWVRSKMPAHHLTGDTKNTVNTSMGLVATMTALVLGLLVASAKGSYDTERNQMTAIQTKVAFLDRILATYGEDAADARVALRAAITQVVSRLWPSQASEGPVLAPDTHSGEAVYRAIRKLSPKNDIQSELRSQALTCAADIGQMRWSLYEESGKSISTPMLIIVICWLATLFFSFGLFSPANGTALISLFVAAMSVSGAILLILELDQPFGGLISISPQPMHDLLAILGK